MKRSHEEPIMPNTNHYDGNLSKNEFMRIHGMTPKTTAWHVAFNRARAEGKDHGESVDYANQVAPRDGVYRREFSPSNPRNAKYLNN